MHLTALTRRWLAVVSSVPVAACLLVFFLCSASADLVQNRRILDIESKKLGDKCRIIIHMDKATRPLVTLPAGGDPLKIELGRSEVEPSVRVDQLTGPLLRKASVAPSDSGLVTINLELTTSQVDVTDFLLEQEALVIVDIKPRHAVALPDESAAAPAGSSVAARSAVAAPSAPPSGADGSTSASASAHQASPVSLALPPVAAPEPAPAPAAGAGPALPALALPAPDGAPASLAQAGQPLNLATGSDTRLTSGSPVDLVTTKEVFPVSLLTLDCPGAREILAAFQAGKFTEAIKLGMPALRQRQSPASLDSLVYLLAECRYQLTTSYVDVPVSKRLAGWDWPEAQNHYEQARRFAPNSPLRPFADFRLSQIYGRLGDLAGCQATLRTILDRRELPNLPQVLLDYGATSFELHTASPSSTATLFQAMTALKAYRDRFPDDERRPDALFLLGETYYQLGNDGEAYANFREGSLWRIPVRGEKHAHWGLAAHRTGMTDLTMPTRSIGELEHLPKGTVPEYKELLSAYVRSSNDPAVHLELARILDQAGKRREAMSEYQRVVHGLGIAATPSQLLQARRALANYALEDRRSGKFDPDIPFDDYANAEKSLADMYENCLDIKTRTELLRDRANHLLAEGRNADAAELILPHLGSGRIPQSLSAQLSQALWQPLREIMDGLYRSGEHLEAMRLYKTFGNRLADHPQRNEILLTCAHILLENDMRDQALQALDHMSPYEDLTPEQKVASTLLRRELLLDPAKPESLKRDGAALLKDEPDDAARARILRMLARTYSDEGQHAYAAQLDREGAALKGLSLADRVDFFLEAARQYEAGKVYSKAIETYYQAIYALEEDGVAPVEAHDWYGPSLIGMAQNFERLGDYDQSAHACMQYLKYFPDGAQADLAHYTLGQSYEQQAAAGTRGGEAHGLRAKALEQYDTLAQVRAPEGAPAVAADAAPTSLTFWQNLGQKSADQLRWEQDHPYLQKEEGLP